MTSAFSWQNFISFALLHSVFQGQICLLLLVILNSYLCIPVPYNEKDISFCVLILEDLVSLHRTFQFQLLQHYWLGHRLGSLWYWMICLGNEQRSFCHFWDCIQVLHSWENAMAPHSSTLAWKIPWMEEPGGLQSMGSLRVGHDWTTSLSLFTFMHWRRKWQPTPVFLPGESQGQGSLVGWCLWGCTESDTTEVT